MNEDKGLYEKFALHVLEQLAYNRYVPILETYFGDSASDYEIEIHTPSDPMRCCISFVLAHGRRTAFEQDVRDNKIGFIKEWKAVLYKRQKEKTTIVFPFRIATKGN